MASPAYLIRNVDGDVDGVCRKNQVHICPAREGVSIKGFEGPSGLKTGENRYLRDPSSDSAATGALLFENLGQRVNGLITDDHPP